MCVDYKGPFASTIPIPPPHPPTMLSFPAIYLGPSASICNPSLAWAMGNGGKGRLIIEFPFALDKGWYTEQACTKFETFEHRKERRGFRHEFILLRLLDGSVCRIERMGDPNARFDALSPQGVVAYDMAQCFRPEDINQAYLSTSDTIAEVTLPYKFDIMDVLKICRAIHEGGKTRNYTLQIFNCYFFSLTIQACLTRLITHWEDKHFFKNWLSQVTHGIEVLGKPSQSRVTAIPAQLNNEPLLFRLYSILTPHKDYSRCKISLLDKLKFKLQRRIDHAENTQHELECWVDKLLWHSAIEPSLKQFLEEKFREIFAEIIKESVTAMSLASLPDSHKSGGAKELKGQLLLRLERIFALHTVDPITGTKTQSITKNSFLEPGCTKQLPAHSRKPCPTRLRPRVRVLSFKGKPAVRPEDKVTMDWYQWVALCFPYFWLWLLHTVHNISSIKILALGTDAILCDLVDEKLGYMLADLECLDTITYSDLEKFVNQTSSLIENKVAVWNKNPWADCYDRVRQHMLVDTLKEIEKKNKKIKVRSKAQLKFRTTTVTEFQSRILGRIKAHAQDVERVWLGSATIIEIELENMISQVWKLMCGDRRVDNREIKVDEGLGQTNPGRKQSDPNAAAVVPNVNLRLYQEPLDTESAFYSVYDVSSRLISTNSQIWKSLVTSWLYYLPSITLAMGGMKRSEFSLPLSDLQLTPSVPPSESNDTRPSVKKPNRLVPADGFLPSSPFSPAVLEARENQSPVSKNSCNMYTSENSTSDIASTAEPSVLASPVSLIMPGSNARTFSLNIGTIPNARPLVPSPVPTSPLLPQAPVTKNKKAKLLNYTPIFNPQFEERQHNASSQLPDASLSTTPPGSSTPDLEMNVWQIKLAELAKGMSHKERELCRKIFCGPKDPSTMRWNGFDKAMRALHFKPRALGGNEIEYTPDPHYFGSKSQPISFHRSHFGADCKIGNVKAKLRSLRAQYPAAVAVLHEAWGLVDILQ